MSNEALGKWIFLIGVIIGIIAVFLTDYADYLILVVFILGLIIGFLGIAEKNLVKLLLAAVALLVSASSIRAISILGEVSQYIAAILLNFTILVGAIVLVVSIKSVIEVLKK